MGREPLPPAPRRPAVSLPGAVRAYAAHPDPLTAACNILALMVASNQPFYPFYLWWGVGGDWPVAFLTLLSTPFFLAVPLVARRHALAGRLLLPATGIANTMLSARAFGAPSGVELFLIPCALIALLAVRREEGRAGAAIILPLLVAAVVLGHQDGAPFGRFDAEAYRHFRAINHVSVAMLTLLILWSLLRARLASRPLTATATAIDT